MMVFIAHGIRGEGGGGRTIGGGMKGERTTERIHMQQVIATDMYTLIPLNSFRNRM